MKSFSGKPRDECLNETLFATLRDARKMLEDWREDDKCRAMDNGIQFTEQPRNQTAAYFQQMRSDMSCQPGSVRICVGSGRASQQASPALRRELSACWGRPRSAPPARTRPKTG
ncbi:integrase core domain-containing protein [Primorskyibacter flagellatus]|uniref:integrase core domain-containing protein n=1 Tax=Primorskyibacter flagellatus TaxID=1387277 RepID=UPI003A902378